jgi:glucosyl-3-phosphoglycerate phosphatase
VVDLILLRHGRTEWNAVRRIQGHSDSQLDPVGHAQAEAVAPVIASMSPAVLWSSDSVRARDTADYVARQCGLVPTYDARLREYSLGIREGLHHDEYEADDPAEYAEFVRANFDAVPSAEKSVEVARRMTEALAELVALVPPNGVGVAVSHGAALRAAIATMVGWPPGQEHSLRGMDNCGWAVLRSAAPGDPWRLVAYNRTAPTR